MRSFALLLVQHGEGVLILPHYSTALAHPFRFYGACACATMIFLFFSRRLLHRAFGYNMGLQATHTQRVVTAMMKTSNRWLCLLGAAAVMLSAAGVLANSSSLCSQHRLGDGECDSRNNIQECGMYVCMDVFHLWAFFRIRCTCAAAVAAAGHLKYSAVPPHVPTPGYL